jgi:hypothetical protein
LLALTVFAHKFGEANDYFSSIFPYCLVILSEELAQASHKLAIMANSYVVPVWGREHALCAGILQVILPSQFYSRVLVVDFPQFDILWLPQLVPFL